MKIEKLNDNKIKVIFSINELKKQNIDYHSFMSNSVESRIIFSSLLCKAKEELNFNTEGFNLSVDTFELNDGNFILTISKASNKKKKVILKRKLGNIHNNSCIYKFSSIENFYDFCYFLEQNSPIFLEKLKNKNSLFKINSDYFLLIQNLYLNYVETGLFSTTITEFADFVNSSNSLISKFVESSPSILEKNAIEIVLSNKKPS